MRTSRGRAGSSPHVSGELPGDVAGKLVGEALGGDRAPLHVDLEKKLRDKLVDVVSKKLQGLADNQGKQLANLLDDKVSHFVGQKLGAAVGGKLGRLAGGLAGDAAKSLTKSAVGEVAEQLQKQVSKLASDKLAGDDKGAVRHDEKLGHAIAAKRLESLRAGRRAASFETNALDLRPGTVFSLLNPPRSDLGPAEKLLVTELALEGTPNGEWSTSGQVVSASHPYRPPLKTPKPSIQGLQSAIVVGPQGQEIHTDEHGRVRVQFHWDRAAPAQPPRAVGQARDATRNGKVETTFTETTYQVTSSVGTAVMP